MDSAKFRERGKQSKKKKLLLVLLCLMLLAGLVPQGTLFTYAAGEVTYEPLITEHTIFNRFNYNSESYYNLYAKGAGAWAYNAVGKFGNLGGTHTRKSDGYKWNGFVSTAYGQLIKDGQLRVCVSATLHNVSHVHKSGLKQANSVAYQAIMLRQGNSYLAHLTGLSFVDQGTATVRHGDRSFNYVGSSEHDLSLTIYVGHTLNICNDGDCTIGDISVTFADISDPQITKVSVRDADGKKIESAKAGSEAYLRVKFSEPIRFADNSKNHGDVSVRLKCGSEEITATLTELKSDYLTFRFTVPSITGNRVVNSANLAALFTPSFLNQVKNGASFEAVDHDGEGYDRSSTLITDIAGNPLKSPSADKSVSMDAFYIDCEAPYISSITKSADMKNSDVKAALGTPVGENDPSDTRAGVGDKITFTANFNEQILFDGKAPYKSANFKDLEATLNVRNSDGTTVILKSASMSQNSGGVNAPNNGPSKGMYTSVTFEPFTVKSGMYCADGNDIRVVSIQCASGVQAADLVGHAYGGTSVPSPPLDTLNKNPFKLDTTPPVVTAGDGVETDSSGSGTIYTPITEERSGLLVTAFRFPIHIEDDSGANALQGAFSWINNEVGGTAFPFEYAVTYGEETPSEWEQGAMGVAYPFTQVEGVGNANRIHIRLINGPDYDLADTLLKITAKDYAGNTGDTLFDLNYIVDGSAPKASVSNVLRQTGTLTVKALVTDPGGLKEIDYQWTDGTDPDPDTGWKSAGSFTEGDTSALIDADKSGITPGNPFSGYLFIKAEDCWGHVSVTPLGFFEYDMSAPDYTASYTQEKRPEAELAISGLETDGTVAVMLRNSLYTVGADTEEYYIRIIDDASYSGDVLDDNASDWSKYAVQTAGGDYSFAYIGGGDDFLSDVLDGTYYGPLDLILLAGNSDAFTYDTDGRLTSVSNESFNLSAVPVVLSAASGSVPDIHETTITTGGKLSNSVTKPLTDSTPTFDADDPADDVLSTLAGTKFTVSLSNKIVPSWNITDIDFNNTYITVIRRQKENGTTVNEKVVDRLTLSPAANQTVTLPEADYPSGFYTVRLTVTAKASGKAETFDYSGQIVVDATKASESFGLSLVYTDYIDARYGLKAADTQIRRYYGPLNDGHSADILTQYTADVTSDAAIYLPVNTSHCALTFTADYEPVTGYDSHEFGMKAIKVWNVTGLDTTEAAAAKAAAGWLAAWDPAHGYAATVYHDAVFVDSASEIIGNSGGNKLPLIKNTLNQVAIQVANANGLMSEIRYVYFYPVDAQVRGTVYVTDTGGQYVTEGKLIFTPEPGQLMDGTSVYSYRLTSPAETQPLSLDPDGNYTYTLNKDNSKGNHFYRVYTVDSYGNYTLFCEEDLGINWWWTDRGAPEVLATDASSESANFTVNIEFKDDTINAKSGQALTLYFDSLYMNALGLTYAEDENHNYTGDSFRLTLPVPALSEGKVPVFSASESNPYGICQVSATRKAEDTLDVEIQGAIRFDSTLAEGTGVSHTLYAVLTDPLGNATTPEAITLNTKNVKPAYESGEYARFGSGFRYGGFRATFNTPVVVKPSLATLEPSGYGRVKAAELPVFGDGEHTITFYDIFGNEWMQNITVSNVFGGLSLSVRLSEPGYTKDPVTVSISADGPDTTFSVFTYPDLEPIHYPTNSGEYLIEESTALQLQIYPSGDSAIELIYINNILSGAPNATLHWYFEEFQSNTLPAGITQTTGKAIVWYTTSRPVTPWGGTSASHTFRYGEASSYTFQYVDEAGNIGSVTADLTSLGLTLAEPPLPPTDNTPPEFEITIYGKIGGVPNPAGYYSSRSTPLTTNPSTGQPMTLSDVINDTGYVQSYYFDISVTEDSPYRLLLFNGLTPPSSVTYDSAGESVAGVSLSGRTLTGNAPAGFTAVIVDARNNTNSFSLSLGPYLDNTPPTVETVKVYENFYKSRVYFKLSDLSDNGTQTSTAALLSTAGLVREGDAHPDYPGLYYCVFTENRTLMVTAADAAGNRVSASAEERTLDTAAPTAKVSWSPHYYEDGFYDSGSPPNRLTNGDVVARVRYDKPVNISPPAISAGGVWTPVADDNEYFTLTRASEEITVRFHKGPVVLKLDATALNGKTCSAELFLPDVVDTVPPNVSASVTYNYNPGYSSGTPVSAKITLSVINEDVYLTNFGQSGIKYPAGDKIEITVYEKGRYTYIFADEAGNSRTVAADVTQDMDRTPPIINIVKGTEVVNNKVQVTVSSSEAGRLAVNDASGSVLPERSVAKDEPVTVTIEYNGSYTVTARDGAGNKSTAAFVVGGIDREKPSIAFSPSTVNIRQNSSPAALTALLETGFTVRDNMTEAENITVNYNASGVNLAETGIYPVTYSAIDAALNVKEAVRYVKVYPENELEVLLSGIRTENGGTTLLNSRAVILDVRNPLGNEPYTVYLRPGLKTAGQMKWSYTIVVPDQNGTFTLPANGFYTLYIVTQSRQSYLIKLSVQP